MPDQSEKVVERLREDLENILSETTEALDRLTKTQIELVCQATDMMTRGYVGVLSGTTGAIMLSYAGFLRGFSRAWDRTPTKTAKKKPSSKARGKKA